MGVLQCKEHIFVFNLYYSLLIVLLLLLCREMRRPSFVVLRRSVVPFHRLMLLTCPCFWPIAYAPLLRYRPDVVTMNSLKKG